MAMAFVVEVPGATAEDYLKVNRKVNETGAPAGCVFHGAGPFEGGVRFLEVWESPEAAQAFYTSAQLREASAAAGEGASREQPRVVMSWPVIGIDNGSGWRAIG